MANVSSSESKRREEGCGKWLTKKGKSTIKQLNFKPCLTRTLKPIIFEGKTKSCKMKQSTMSQFLGEKPAKMRKENISNERSTFRDKVTVVLPLKRRVSSTHIKYEDLWGSDSDENDTCENEDNIQKASQGEKQKKIKDSPTVYSKDAQIENNFQRNYICTKNMGQKDTRKVFPSPKRLRKSKDNTDQDIGTGSNSAGNEIDFTEWFENEVDGFNIQHHNKDKNAVNKENLWSMSCRYPSSCKPSDSEEELPQFSEWFNQHIQKTNHKELPINITQSPARDVLQHNSTFTQWFEANLDNIKSPS